MSSTIVPFDFQAFAWHVDDGVSNENDYENMNFTVHVFGKTRDGKSVATHVKGYNPFFCVKFDPKISNHLYYDNLTEVLETILIKWDTTTWEKVAEYGDHLISIKDKIVRKKNLWGYSFGKEVPFFKFAFKSKKAYDQLLGLFKACQRNTLSEDQMVTFFEEYKGFLNDEGKWDRDMGNDFLKEEAANTGIPERCYRWIVKLGNASLPFGFAKGKLFEVIDPILRFAHLRHLKMAGWMKLTKYEVPNFRKTTCAIEYNAHYDNLESIICDDISVYIKEMAFDIESYSYNDMFPDPEEPQNYAYQIGITLKNYADKGFHRILLHCQTPKELRGGNSGKCSDIPDCPTCLRSSKPIEDCDKSECIQNGHDVFDVKTIVHNYPNEKALLLAFSDFIVKEDPDIIYGYNSDTFDWNYLMVRAKVTGCLDKFSRMSRLKNFVCKSESKSFNSSAYGDNKYMRVDLPGRLNIDLMVWIQRNMPQDRYPSYSLNSVAEKEINEQKRDVSAKDIFRAFREGNPKELAAIADYCCQDTVLVQKLVIKLDVVTQMFEMANITDTPPMYLMQKGQQIKCFSQISKEALEKNFLIPLADDREDGKFKGAIVLEPKIGKYDTPTAVLDFASLYPSIQVACGVCYTTIVLDKNLHALLKKKKMAKDIVVVKGIEYVEYEGTYFDLIEWDEDIVVYTNRDTGARQEFASLDDAKSVQPKKMILANIDRNDNSDSITWRMEKRYHSYAFAQQQPSVIPELQIKLKKSRKAVKAMMAPIEHSKDPDDQLRYRVLNGRQLAIKVSMNSLYGFTSAFMLNMMPLSASVTAKGRQMIESTQDFMENKFEKIAKERVWSEEDFMTFFAADGKQVKATEVGDEWVFNFYGKELYRGKKGETPPGWIKKYPIAEIGKPWSGHDLRINVVGGDSVTGDTPILCRDSKGTMFYRTIDNIGSGEWQTRVDGKEYQMCEFDVWSDKGFTPVRHIIRHCTDKKMFRVSTNSGIVDVTEDHSLLRPDGKKVKATELKRGHELLHAEDLPLIVFPLCSVGSDGVTVKGFKFNTKLKLANFYHQMRSKYYLPKLWNDVDDGKFYCGFNNERFQCTRDNEDKITKIIELPKTEQFVYDIETESHRFHVGPGRMVVSNTDSVFANFPESGLNETISLCHKAADILTDVVFNRPPIEMEYEKTYMPIVIQKKKNYIGMKYEMDDFRWKIDFKGIAVKRRNYCDFVKQVFWEVIYKAFAIEPVKGGKFRKVDWDFRLGPNKAVEALQEQLLKLSTGEIPIDDLVMSASIKSAYKGPTCTKCKGDQTLVCLSCEGKGCENCKKGKRDCGGCWGRPKKNGCRKCLKGRIGCPMCGGRGNIVNLPHIQLAQRMKERDEQSAPVSGQRFGFIIVNEDCRSSELSARSEDPKFAKANNLKPDYLFYLDQQIRKPLTKFLTLLGKGPETEKVFEEVQMQLFKQLKESRAKTEVEARKQFFSAKRSAPVEPLKAPKKQTVSKKQKQEDTINNTRKLSSYGIFKPKE